MVENFFVDADFEFWMESSVSSCRVRTLGYQCLRLLGRGCLTFQVVLGVGIANGDC